MVFDPSHLKSKKSRKWLRRRHTPTDQEARDRSTPPGPNFVSHIPAAASLSAGLQATEEPAAGKTGKGLKIDLNQKAADNPRDYVYLYANNNWFQVKEQYEEGLLLHSDRDKDAKVHGMNALLGYRTEIVNKLLEEVRPLANEDERQNRQKMWFNQFGAAQLFGADNSSARKKARFIKQTPPFSANKPGSAKPTSDIDVNTSGGGSEFAVRWLNQTFRERYGKGQEPGVVYDLNFYGKDYMPGTYLDKMQNKGKLQRKKGRKFIGAKQWKEHVTGSDAKQKEERDDQTLAALTMMRVNMDDEDWEKYVEKAVVQAPAIADKLKRASELAQERKNLIKDADAGLSEGDSRRGVTAGALAQLKQDSEFAELATMAAENAVYERLLEKEVAPKRILFEMLKSSGADRAALDEAYVAYNKAKANALMYANASYYTQGSVVGVVANKQRLGRTYKDKAEAIGADGKIANRKLQLSPHEWYQMFTEQIGFAMHGLHGHKWTRKLFRQKVPDMGKYVHRAANALKYLYGQGGDGSSGIGGTNPLTEEQRQAAAGWEGVKQGKRKGRSADESKKGYQYGLDHDQAAGEFSTILQDFGVHRREREADTVYNIKQRLIDLKAKVDGAYFAYIGKEERSSSRPADK